MRELYQVQYATSKTDEIDIIILLNRKRSRSDVNCTRSYWKLKNIYANSKIITANITQFHFVANYINLEHKLKNCFTFNLKINNIS